MVVIESGSSCSTAGATLNFSLPNGSRLGSLLGPSFGSAAFPPDARQSVRSLVAEDTPRLGAIGEIVLCVVQADLRPKIKFDLDAIFNSKWCQKRTRVLRLRF